MFLTSDLVSYKNLVSPKLIIFQLFFLANILIFFFFYQNHQLALEILTLFILNNFTDKNQIVTEKAWQTLVRTYFKQFSLISKTQTGTKFQYLAMAALLSLVLTNFHCIRVPSLCPQECYPHGLRLTCRGSARTRSTMTSIITDQLGVAARRQWAHTKKRVMAFGQMLI